MTEEEEAAAAAAAAANGGAEMGADTDDDVAEPQDSYFDVSGESLAPLEWVWA